MLFFTGKDVAPYKADQSAWLHKPFCHLITTKEMCTKIKIFVIVWPVTSRPLFAVCRIHRHPGKWPPVVRRHDALQIHGLRDTANAGCVPVLHCPAPVTSLWRHRWSRSVTDVIPFCLRVLWHLVNWDEIAKLVVRPRQYVTSWWYRPPLLSVRASEKIVLYLNLALY